MTSFKRRLVVSAAIATTLTVLGVVLAAWDPWIAIWPLGIGLLLRDPLSAISAGRSWGQVNTVPWTVVMLNFIGWTVVLLVVTQVLPRRRAA